MNDSLPTNTNLLSLISYRYLVSADATAIPGKVFNTIGACLGYIAGQGAEKIGKIFVKRKNDGTTWKENIELLATEINWSNLEIEFDNNAILEGVKDKDSNKYGSAILIDGAGSDRIDISDRTWSYTISTNTFTKLTGSDITVPGSQSMYFLINNVVYKSSAITATTIVLDTTFKKYKGIGDYNYPIVISCLLENYFFNIKIKANIDANYHNNTTADTAMKGISCFACDLEFDGFIKNCRRNNDSLEVFHNEWYYTEFLNSQSRSGIGVTCNYSTLKIKDIINCSTNFAGSIVHSNAGLYSQYSAISARNIMNCFCKGGAGYDGGIGIVNTKMTVNNIINCYASANAGAGIITTKSTLKFNTIRNCRAGSSTGGIVVTDDSNVSGNIIENCEAETGVGGGANISGHSVANIGTVSNNKTLAENSRGGGIIIDGESSLTVGQLINNNAYSSGSFTQGGGIYITDTCGLIQIGMAQGNVDGQNGNNNIYNNATAGTQLIDIVQSASYIAGNARATGSREVVNS